MDNLQSSTSASGSGGGGGTVEKDDAGRPVYVLLLHYMTLSKMSVSVSFFM